MKEDLKRYLVIVLTMILIFAYSIHSSGSNQQVREPSAYAQSVSTPARGESNLLLDLFMHARNVFQ